jgi:hypothetical protein
MKVRRSLIAHRLTPPTRAASDGGFHAFEFRDDPVLGDALAPHCLSLDRELARDVLFGVLRAERTCINGLPHDQAATARERVRKDFRAHVLLVVGME